MAKKLKPQLDALGQPVFDSDGDPIMVAVKNRKRSSPIDKYERQWNAAKTRSLSRSEQIEVATVMEQFFLGEIERLSKRQAGKTPVRVAAMAVEVHHAETELARARTIIRKATDKKGPKPEKGVIAAVDSVVDGFLKAVGL